jgi:hypothetical protein
MAEKSSWDQANIQQKLGLVWSNRKKISQIIKNYFYLLFFLLIILWFHTTTLVLCKTGVGVFESSRVSARSQLSPLKGHGNEADFLGFLQKSVRHRFLTLNFELFRFGLHIRGDIHNRKTTPRLAESGSQQECLKIQFFSTL